MHRAPTEKLRRIAATFLEWGTPTAESICHVRHAAPDLPIIASGGLRSGLDIAKCIGLGASLGSMAGPFLKAAVQSVEAVVEEIEITQTELKIAMFAAGIPDLAALQNTPLLVRVG
jgi:isopentenyl-diphosphate delta-isomerase